MEKVGFSKEQIEFMKSNRIDYNNYDEVLEKTDRLLRTKGFLPNYDTNSIGAMCESILDTLADIEDAEE